jgi:hypothetical protein
MTNLLQFCDDHGSTRQLGAAALEAVDAAHPLLVTEDVVLDQQPGAQW